MSSVQCESNQCSTPKTFWEHFLVSRTGGREEHGKMQVATAAFSKQEPGG